MGNIEHKTLNEMLGLESVLKFRHVVWVARKGRAVRVNTSLSCTRGWGGGGVRVLHWDKSLFPTTCPPIRIIREWDL